MLNKTVCPKKLTLLSSVTIALASLAFICTSAQAQWVYTDVSATNNSATPNTFNATTDLADDWASPTGVSTDGAGNPLWRYRDTGPGAPAFGVSAFTGNLAGGPDVNIYTLITGLTPSTAYFVRVYGVYPQNSTNQPLAGSRFGAEFSLDGASTWTIVDNHGSLPITWVDNSTGVGVEQPTVNAGDTRFYSLLPTQVITDGSGVARIDVRIPATLSDGQATDRFNIDGYALNTVPEPSTIALFGLAGIASVWMRRRIKD